MFFIILYRPLGFSITDVGSVSRRRVVCVGRLHENATICNTTVFLTNTYRVGSIYLATMSILLFSAFFLWHSTQQFVLHLGKHFSTTSIFFFQSRNL